MTAATTLERRRRLRGPCHTLPSASSLILPLFLLLLALVPSLPVVRSLDFGYHDNRAVERFLTNISQTYPHLTRLYSAGRSVRGRDLWVIVIGQSPRDHVTLRPNVKYVANMHGNEVVGRELLLHLTEYLVQNYGLDHNVSRLLNTTTIHLMPSMNPDGFAVANTTDCNGYTGRQNANNYDLNRNFPDFFRVNRAPLQKETLEIMNWLNNTRFVLSANLHGGIVVANYPFDSYPGTGDRSLRYPKRSPTPDDDVFQHLARTYSFTHPTMHLGRRCDVNDVSFRDGVTNGAQWYQLKGGMQDYNYVRGSCYELTLELSCCKYPPASELPAFWQANRQALITYLLKVHMGVKGLIKDTNNNVLKDAEIKIKGRELVTFYTSQYGEYFKLLLPGTYTLLVSKRGYESRNETFEVARDAVTRLDMVLRPADVGSLHVELSSDTDSKGSNLVLPSFWFLFLGFLSLRYDFLLGTGGLFCLLH